MLVFPFDWRLDIQVVGVSKQSEWAKIKRERGVQERVVFVFAMLMLFCSTDDREYAARDVF